MKTITYTFADGTQSAVEVNDELGAAIAETEQAEKRNHWRETRRHVSMDYLSDNGIDIEDTDGGDALSALIEKEDGQEFDEMLSSALKPKQIEMLKMIWDGYSVKEIAEREGVSHQAISKQLKNILEKLKVFSAQGCDLPSAVLIGRGKKSAYYELRGLRK